MSKSSFIDMSLFSTEAAFVDAHQVSVVNYELIGRRAFLLVQIGATAVRGEMLYERFPQLDQSKLAKLSKITEAKDQKYTEANSKWNKKLYQMSEDGTEDYSDATTKAKRDEVQVAYEEYQKAKGNEEKGKLAFEKEEQTLLDAHAKGQVKAFIAAVSAAREFK